MKIYTWDIETRWDSGDIIKIGVYDGTSFYDFNTVEEFWQYLKEVNSNSDDKIYMFAHNHKFDLSGILMDEFSLKNIEVELTRTLFTRNKRVLKLGFKGLKNIEFRDSFALFPMALKKVLQGFKVKHLKLDVLEEAAKEGWNFKSEKEYFNKVPVDCPSLHRYLRNDVVGLHDAMIEFVKITGVKPSKMLTAASVAMAVYKTQFSDDFKKMVTNKLGKKKYYTKQIKDFSRRAYKGGRVEVVKRKGTNVYKYDVNSLYPFVMSNFEFPSGNYRFYNEKVAKAKLNMMRYSENRELGIVDVTVEIPMSKIPPLPVRVKDKLYFPVDELRNTFTTEELLYSVNECGVKIKKVHGMWLWDEKCKPFKNFIDKFYKIKSEEDGAKRFIAKLLMNSLYGKFGMREEGLKLVYEEDYLNNKKLQDKELTGIKDIGNKKVYVLKDKIYSDYILPHIAAYAASYARIVLHSKITDVLQKGYDVYYYDTDSVHTNCPSEEFEDIDNKKLGFWKYEGFEEVMYYATPKLYGGKNTTKAKGIPKEHQPSFEMFKQMIEGNEVFKHIFEGKRFVTLWEVLTNRDIKEREVAISKIVCLLNSKRKPVDLYDTIPWRYSEIINLDIKRKNKRGRNGKVKDVIISVNGKEIKLYTEFVEVVERIFDKGVGLK